MNIRVLACIAAASLSSTAQDALPWPKILEGNGRACFGHLWSTGKTLYWESVFTSCRSPYTVVSHEGEQWLLKVQKSKTCAYELIGIKHDESNMYPWLVTAYLYSSDLNNKNVYPMDCGMLPVTYPINPDTRRHHKGAGK